MNEILELPMPILGAMALVVVVGLFVFVLGLTKKWGMLYPYALMVLFSCMATPMDWRDRVIPTVWLPIQQNRSTLYLAAGIGASLMMLAQINNLRGKPQSSMSWIILTAGFYAAMMRFVHEGPASGVASVFFAVMTLVPMVLLPAIVIRELDDFKLILRAIVISNCVWVLMVLMQIAVNPTFVTLGNEFRFMGLLSNPQHAGVMLPHICLILIWLIINDSNKYRLFYLFLIGVNGVFLLWTGSRTGAGMIVIGLCAIFYSRAGKAVLIFPVLMLLAYIGLKFMTNVVGNDIGVNRLVSMDNTRDEAWQRLIQQGLENPLTGVGVEGSEKSENSWLYALACYGVGMLAILSLLSAVAFAVGFKWFRARFSIPRYYRPMIDLCIAGVAMYFAGAVLEGYMISRVSASLCFFPIYCGVGAILCRTARTQDAQVYEEAYEYDEYWDSYGDEVQRT